MADLVIPVTKKDVVNIQKYGHSGISSMDARVNIKKDFRPCNNCKQRREFLSRMFKHG